MTNDSGSSSAKPSKFWREFRHALIAITVLVGLLGGYQIWRLVLASHEVVVTLVAQADPLAAGESTAQWLLPHLDVDLALNDADEPLRKLEAASGPTREGLIKVKGKAMDQAVKDGRVEARLRYVGSQRVAPLATLTPQVTSEGALRYELGEALAQDLLGRSFETTVAIMDDLRNPIQQLRARPGIPFRERGDRAGVYELGLPLESLIWIREDGDVLSLEVWRGAAAEPAGSISIPVSWFLDPSEDSRVVVAALIEAVVDEPVAVASEIQSTMQGKSAEQTPVEASVAKPSPPVLAAETPVADTTARERERQEELLRVRNAILTSIEREQWSRAYMAILNLEGITGASDETREWSRQVEAGQEAARLREERRLQELSRDQTPTQPTTAEPEIIADPTPVVQPPSTEQLIDDLLARYVQSQNQLDVELYTGVYPGIASSRGQIEDAWKTYRSQLLELERLDLNIDGESAVARCRQKRTVNLAVGRTQVHEGNFRFRLAHSGTGWIIDAIEPE